MPSQRVDCDPPERAALPAGERLSGQGVAGTMTGLVQPFISTVAGSLDSKGRVCIPATYRHLLSAQNTTGVYVCPSFIDPALDCFGQELLDRINARLAGQDTFFSASFDDEATALIARTQSLPIDENGRVRIPDAMIEHAGLKDRIVLSARRRNSRSGMPTVMRPSKRKLWRG